MKLIEIREKLAKLNLPVFTLQDIIGLFQIDKTHASKLMNRLEKTQSLVKIQRGIWAWPNIEPLTVSTYLTAPLPCYISLQSALFYHGIIEQIPECFYSVTLGRTREVNTVFGKFSFHHLKANLFFGFETQYNPFFQIAIPEKALFDYFYLSRLKPYVFGRLPEINFTKLQYKKLKNMIDQVENKSIKTFMQQKLR